MHHPRSLRPDIRRLERALRTVAVLVAEDPVYLPIFARLEEELCTARDEADAIARARALAGQSAIRASTSRR